MRPTNGFGTETAVAPVSATAGNAGDRIACGVVIQ